MYIKGFEYEHKKDIVMAMIIFGFSKQDGEESSGLSYKAADIILTVCDKAGIIDCNENNRESMIEAVQFPIRKAAHMTEYAILGWIAFAFLGSCGIQGKMHYIAVLGFNFCYASTDEIHQLFIPGRSGQFKDVCIDTAGTAIGLLLLAILLKIWRRHCAKRAHTLQ